MKILTKVWVQVKVYSSNSQDGKKKKNVSMREEGNGSNCTQNS